MNLIIQRVTTIAFLFILPYTGLAERFTFKDCYASWNETELKVGNTMFERVWNCDENGLRTTRFVIKGSPEIVIAEDNRTVKTDNSIEINASSGRRSAVGSEGIKLDVVVKGANQKLEMWLYPETGGVLIQQISGTVEHQNSDNIKISTGIEKKSDRKKHAAKNIAGSDSIKFKSIHLRVNQFELMDQTDKHDELLFEREWLLMHNEPVIKIKGCVLNVEDVVSDCGLAYIKLGPLPHARQNKNTIDFRIAPGSRTVSAMFEDFSVAAISYRGGKIGFTKAMQRFQRAIRNYRPGRDGLFLSNTWGDRSRDKRIKESFLLKEIEAGAKLGIDIVQVDDGWQKGRSSNSASANGKGVWNGYWDADPEFWDADHERFPNGLERVVQAAKDKSMHFGLWFGPDSSDSAKNWKRDADHLLSFYEMGIHYFKIDSMKTHDAISLNNQRAMFDRMLEKSNGEMVFDLDVTAEIRPGYFGLLDIGPLFVENRYTDWHRYWPHKTLRNLWELARVVDPVRLRMEILNNQRNSDKYKNDPLAPILYKSDTLFAMSMMASPLGWFETSNLPDDYVKQMQPLEHFTLYLPRN